MADDDLVEVEELRASLKTMRAQAPGASTLTDAELRLLPHLATHLSFREIGERLFISRRTVQTHLAHVFTKLGISSRRQLAERLGRPSYRRTDVAATPEQLSRLARLLLTHPAASRPARSRAVSGSASSSRGRTAAGSSYLR